MYSPLELFRERKLMDKLERTKTILDCTLLFVHISYVIGMFLIVLHTPYYVSFFFMLPQLIQDVFYRECILTEYQRTYGYAKEDEDCFHYLFRQFKLEVSPRFTSILNHVIHLIILILFLYKVSLVHS